MATNPTNIYYPITSSTDYVVPFPYLSPSHVKVTIGGVGETANLISQNTVRIPSGHAGKTLRIYRETPKSPIHTWEDGAVILGTHMNAANLQSVYIAEEAYGYAEGLAEEAKQYALNGASDALMASLNTAIGTLSATIAGPLEDAQAAADAANAAANTLETALTEIVEARNYVDNRADNASTSADAAEAARVAMRKLYLGGYPSDPTMDLEGGALQDGALYFNTVSSKMKIWEGAVWQLAYNSVEVPPAQSASDVSNDSAVTGTTVKDALNTLSTGKAATGHGHGIADVSGLGAALDSKADDSHGHLIADVDGLDAALASKADAIATVEALSAKANASQLAAKANVTVAVTGSGLATGGGDLSTSRAIEVLKATGADVRGSVNDNKALTTKAVYDALAEVPITNASTLSVDMAAGDNFGTTMLGNRTLANPTGAVPGKTGRIRFTQDGTGGRTLTFGSAWKFAGGVAPTLTTTPNATDYLDYEVVAAANIRANLTKAWA